MTTTTYALTVGSIGEVELTVSADGPADGRPYLLLHGGAGAASMRPLAAALAGAGDALVLTPVHPGFEGTSRPASLSSVRDLALVHAALLDRLGLSDVTVVGNSVGGWLAAELALLGSVRVARLVLLDATGIEVAEHPLADITGLAPDQVLGLAFHDPAPFRRDPATLSAAERDAAVGNRSALAAYAGASGSDASLRSRLAGVRPATLVLWGASDRIADVDYGAAYAGAVPGSQFLVLPEVGHVPQLEDPGLVADAVRDFVATHGAWEHELVLRTPVAPGDVWSALAALYSGTRLAEDGDTIELHGPFAVGTRLSVTPHGADFVVDCEIVDLVEGETYAYRSAFDGLHITSRHTLTALDDGGTRVTQLATIAGPGAETIGPRIGPRITADHPQAMDDLIEAARTGSAYAEGVRA